VCYQHHPLHGQEVEVVRAIRHGIDPSVIVRLGDGIEVAMPCWMLDLHKCAALKQEASPRVSIQALVALADLVDLHRDQLADTSGSSPQPGASDEPEVFPRALSNASSV
jgi:uncharacterized protein DUF5372